LLFPWKGLCTDEYAGFFNSGNESREDFSLDSLAPSNYILAVFSEKTALFSLKAGLPVIERLLTTKMPDKPESW
jgi:hypothetical protein